MYYFNMLTLSDSHSKQSVSQCSNQYDQGTYSLAYHLYMYLKLHYSSYNDDHNQSDHNLLSYSICLILQLFHQ